MPEMFNSFTFILEYKNSHEDESVMELDMSPMMMIAPLEMIDFKEGEETDIMANVLLTFITELNKKFNIIEVYEKTK